MSYVFERSYDSWKNFEKLAKADSSNFDNAFRKTINEIGSTPSNIKNNIYEAGSQLKSGYNWAKDKVTSGFTSAMEAVSKGNAERQRQREAAEEFNNKLNEKIDKGSEFIRRKVSDKYQAFKNK